MHAKHLLLALMLFLTAGCAHTAGSLRPAETYPNSYEFFDFAFSWKTTIGPDGATIDGVAENRTYYYIRDLELTATLLDEGGTPIGTGSFLFFPNQLAIGERADFSIPVRAALAAKPKTIRFFYRYYLSEERMSGISRFHTFYGSP
ncbi:FxLYD domain-containing protein [Geobacter sulfurreducens]|uniref:FxLYD domain-containing protein n=1 Tax=Geobacter sulfurreducens TaxID=35554 RepID=UPI000DBB5CA3|nr:FxLYD domain-containing protein [Geobacter sulfurreducens]BBA69395.1 hypothetical protein YM18_0848 [Geobacter sulfurreducens]